MSRLQQFRIVSSGQDAKMICDLLRSHGIEAFCNGAREYSSVFAGGDYGRYEISVPTEQVAQANEILNSLPQNEVSQPEVTELDPRIELKRAVVHAALANCFVPILFTYSSLRALSNYLKAAPASARKPLWILLILILNLNSFAVAYLMVKFLFRH